MFRCPYCQRKYSDGLEAGQKTQCVACRETFEVRPIDPGALEPIPSSLAGAMIVIIALSLLSLLFGSRDEPEPESIVESAVVVAEP